MKRNFQWSTTHTQYLTFCQWFPPNAFNTRAGWFVYNGNGSFWIACHVDDAIGLLYTCPPCIGNVRLHKKRENRNTVIHCIGDMHSSGKVHSDGQSGVRFPGGARFLNNVFHFLIAVCEYSYQFHPIGLWCGSIPHGVTILFFHRVWFFLLILFIPN